MLSNREIGRIAKEMCYAERQKTRIGIYVRTRSYSEVRGGRRIKKYWLAFTASSVAKAFVEELSKKGEAAIYKGYSYRIGYVAEIVNEEAAKSPPKKKIEVPENFFLKKYGSKFEPKYEREGECPNQIEVSEEELPVVMDELLFQIWSKSSVFLEVTEDGKMPFFYQQEVDFLKELCEALRGVTENRILKLSHYVRYWIADDLYGAQKCWKSFIKNR